jgi:hypothetical protein
MSSPRGGGLPAAKSMLWQARDKGVVENTFRK